MKPVAGPIISLGYIPTIEIVVDIVLVSVVVGWIKI